MVMLVAQPEGSKTIKVPVAKLAGSQTIEALIARKCRETASERGSGGPGLDLQCLRTRWLEAATARAPCAAYSGRRSDPEAGRRVFEVSISRAHAATSTETPDRSTEPDPRGLMEKRVNEGKGWAMERGKEEHDGGGGGGV